METMKLGTLMVRGCEIKIPSAPERLGDTFGCNTSEIEIVDTREGKEITWLPLDRDRFDLPKDRQIYICDRVILMGVTWNMLKEAGFVDGKRVTIDGKECVIRLMTGSDGSEGACGTGCRNEWDMMIDYYGERNQITHWLDMYTWCKEADCDYSSYRSIRGYLTARFYNNYTAWYAASDIGFRPALEVLDTVDKG